MEETLTIKIPVDDVDFVNSLFKKCLLNKWVSTTISNAKLSTNNNSIMYFPEMKQLLQVNVIIENGGIIIDFIHLNCKVKFEFCQSLIEKLLF